MAIGVKNASVKALSVWPVRRRSSIQSESDLRHARPVPKKLVRKIKASGFASDTSFSPRALVRA